MFKGTLKPYQTEAVAKMVDRKKMLVAYEMGLGKTPMTIAALEKLKEDGFVEFDDEGLTVTKLGLNFIRNICKAFDLHLLRNEVKNEKPQFSKAI